MVFMFVYEKRPCVAVDNGTHACFVPLAEEQILDAYLRKGYSLGIGKVVQFVGSHPFAKVK